MPKKSKLTKAVKDDIVQRRLQGKTLAEVGHESGLGKCTDQYVADPHICDVKSGKPDYPAAFSAFEEVKGQKLTATS